MGAIAGLAMSGIPRILSSSGKFTGELSHLSMDRMILVACSGFILIAFLLLLLLRDSSICVATGKNDKDFVAPENPLSGGECSFEEAARFQPSGAGVSRRDNPPLHSGGGESFSSIVVRWTADGVRGGQEGSPLLKSSEGTPAGSFVSLTGLFKGIQSRRFIVRLLLVLALWSLFVGSFSPFFNVFFYRRFNQSLQAIGMIFSLSQFCQLLAVLCMPWLMARLGRVRAIVSMQMLAAVFLPVLLLTSNIQVAGLIYLTYLSFQVMSEPALENFIMDSVLPEERSLVSSLRYMTLFLMQSFSVWVTGFAITRFGYSRLLVTLAVIGISASLAFYFSFRSTSSNVQAARVV